ncbi:XRE family transcriptional regulator [Sphingomonas immobilis]|uniref:Helix-turn-helix transcriptional regulator n=1 Tax=Sphingomonas immobilis TaxID=3063997 RepID=A0ABT9A0S3_9SPHN|nr:helix-turn-helix transcriptional regulator [Sphingomonas sp. CA1-15]MDO7843435.1 helix-turn-helix transcriptional regulator [Sphingomonas sp. CA1-15]
MLIERLAEAMRNRGYSQNRLAQEVGISQSAIQQIINGKTSRSKWLPDIARTLGVSVAWLLGEDVEPGRPITMGDIDFVQLTEIDIGYGMGGGTFIEDVSDENQAIFDPRWLIAITRSPPQMLFVARGIGDSMMPTLLDNDTLIVDRGQRRLTQQDRIWALTYGELGMIKRVRRLPSGQFHLLSDNPAIPPITAAEDELNLVGRVVWIGRKA